MTAFGILGGSFDPVHSGHLALASGARAILGLDRVALLPCADPPHKPDRTLAPRHHRLEMLHLAVEGWECLRVSTYEIARGGVHYTIDTLRAMRVEASPRSPVFLLGSDALAEVGSWRLYDELLAEFDFAVASRAGAGVPPPGPAWNVSIDPPLGAGGRVFSLAIDVPDVSSSAIRRRVSKGEPLDDLVPSRVARYIQRHGLYTEEARR